MKSIFFIQKKAMSMWWWFRSMVTGMRRILNMLSIDWRFVYISFTSFFFFWSAINNQTKQFPFSIERAVWKRNLCHVFSNKSIETKTPNTKWCVNWSIMRKNYWRKWILWTGKLTIIYTKQKYSGNIMCENVKTIQSRWTLTNTIWIFCCFHLIFTTIEFSRCRYNKLSRTIRELAKRISEIDAKDPFRTEMSAMLLEKLYVIGLIPTKWDLNNATNISASSFCRRRLPVVMVRSKRFAMSFFFFFLLSTWNNNYSRQFFPLTDNMSEYIKNASDLIEQGHVRVGTDVVKDPAFLVSRTLEDFVTWVDSSKIRKHVMEYNNMVSVMTTVFFRWNENWIVFSSLVISARRFWHLKVLEEKNVLIYIL